MPEPENRFDATRAELFEALGHPIRVKILQTLETRPMGFAELKKEVGIESSGHLEFHLRKLSGLVGTTPEGSYALTDDGREAIRVLNLTSSSSEGIAVRVRPPSAWRGNRTRPFIAVLLILVIVFAGVAVYQQQQIATLNQNLSLATGTVMIGHTTYHYEDISPYAPNGTSITFHGVTFTYLTSPPGVEYSNPENYTAKGSVRLSNGTSLNLNGEIVRVGMTFNIQNQCWSNALGANSTAPGQGQVFYFSLPGIPTIAITFADKSHETFNAPNVTARYEGEPGMPGTEIWLTYAWQGNLANPWLGQHTSPQAGIFFDCISPQNGLTVYVSE